ncbi:MAG: site-specific DNA-methyltransferase, partial [bacterium]|nr:site-specific DNA-methyltransferase [bacterium]
MPRKQKRIKDISTDSYQHPTADSPSRPEVGIQTQFKKKKPAVTYRYDSSLDPQMSWDEGNAAREQGEANIADILKYCAQANEILSSDIGTEFSHNEIETAKQEIKKAQEAALALKSMSKPFLNWTGKAEKPQFSVPTLPLFVHERLSTKAIIETLRGHKKGKDQLSLFGDPQHSITDQILRAYEHRDQWVNRMILGDSLAVMNSLLHYEGLGGQVQMIYIDPPYGIKFGSNFQPFVRKRDVKHNEDDDMTYEPEMVQAYRDTWDLGLHSYLTYMRDRLKLDWELLHPSGSIFVQISDENVHHVRELMDDVFGEKNFVSIITFKKTTGLTGKLLTQVSDYLI